MRELGFSAVMTGAQGLAETVQEFRFWSGPKRNAWVSADRS